MSDKKGEVVVSRPARAESAASQLALTDFHHSKATRASVCTPPPLAMLRWAPAAIIATPIGRQHSDGARWQRVSAVAGVRLSALLHS